MTPRHRRSNLDGSNLDGAEIRRRLGVKLAHADHRVEYLDTSGPRLAIALRRMVRRALRWQALLTPFEFAAASILSGLLFVAGMVAVITRVITPQPEQPMPQPPPVQEPDPVVMRPAPMENPENTRQTPPPAVMAEPEPQAVQAPQAVRAVPAVAAVTVVVDPGALLGQILRTVDTQGQHTVELDVSVLDADLLKLRLL